jgi:hypothetical protein
MAVVKHKNVLYNRTLNFTQPRKTSKPSDRDNYFTKPSCGFYTNIIYNIAASLQSFNFYNIQIDKKINILFNWNLLQSLQIC